MAPKTVYLIPQSNVEKLGARVKAGCDLAGLSACPELWTSMTSTEVKKALEAPFTGTIDFVESSYRFFYINRDLGNALCPVQFKSPNGSPIYPNGSQLYSAYSRRTIIILRLNYDAEVPDYGKGVRLWDRKKGGQVSDEEADEEEEDDFLVCESCNGTFALEKLEAHNTKCPARRKPSGSKRLHSRHQSMPAILSPERKRPRYEAPAEPSSDGEADGRLVHGKRNGEFYVDDAIEEDELIDDPEANDSEEAEDEEDKVKAGPSGTRRHPIQRQPSLRLLR